MQAGLLRDNGKIHNLPALDTESWGCLGTDVDMNGEDFYVDLYGIQWEVEGENTVLFPGENDMDEDAGMVEVNTVKVSADAGIGDVKPALNTEKSFCRTEGCMEEEDNLDKGHNSDSVFCHTSSNVSCSICTSSALSFGMIGNGIDLFADCCNCVDDIHFSSCIGNNDSEICINYDCMNYIDSKICTNCLIDLESVAERQGQAVMRFIHLSKVKIVMRAIK